MNPPSEKGVFFKYHAFLDVNATSPKVPMILLI